MYESHMRSLTKGLTWRVIATLSTIILVYIVTRNLSLTIQIGFIDIAIKFILFYAHERAWINVPWGTSIETEEPTPVPYYP